MSRLRTFFFIRFGVCAGFSALAVFLFYFALIPSVYAATFSMQTGYYFGDDTDDRSIDDVGFSPDFLMVQSFSSTSGNNGFLIKTSTTAGELTLDTGSIATALATNHIQSLHATGFTVGNDADVNLSNNRYYWVAFGGSDCSSSGTFCVGSYTGNGTSQGITDVGFQPDLVIVQGEGATVGIWKSNSMAGTASTFFSNSTADIANGITALDASGFSVGNHGSVNTNNVAYHYIAFKEVADFSNVGAYTGDGTTRDITSADDAGLTFRPDFVFVSDTGNQMGQAAIRENYYRSLPFNNAGSGGTIPNLLTTGGFTVINNNTVNGAGRTYNYAAFAGASIKPASGTFTMTNGSYMGTTSAFSLTGLGFAPDLVIIKHDNQATAQDSVWRPKTLTSTSYFARNTGLFADGITSLDSDGFSVGTHATVNTDGDTYYWTAFGNAVKPGFSGGAEDFLLGGYHGNGVAGQNIGFWSFAPDVLIIKEAGANRGVWRTPDQTGDETLHFHNINAISNSIQDLAGDGFLRGGAGTVNTSGSLYNYFAFATSSRLVTGTYTGNSGSPQDITSVGFQPDLLWIKKTTGGTARVGILRTSVQTGDAAQVFNDSAQTFTGGITALTATGFSVGSSVAANEDAFVYQYAAWDAKQYTQQTYRVFENADSTDVGAPIAAENTPAVLTGSGGAFRLRMLLRVDYGNLFTSGQEFKLQFAGKGAGTCASPSGSPSSYTDVGPGTTIAFLDNSLVADGEALTANGNDPVDGGRTIVNQTYEEGNNFTNSEGAIGKGQDGKWDFSLFDNAAPGETEYCFRIVRANGEELDGYTVYPEITTSASGNSLPVVDEVVIDGGNSAVTLIEGTTQDVQCSATVTDADGHADVESVQAFFFRTSVGTSTPDDNNHKYTLEGDSECVPSGGSGTVESYTCTFAVLYYADPTDAGSPYSSDTWTCEVRAYDGTATSSPATDTVEMNSLIALSIDPTDITYGTVLPGNTSTGPSVTLTNTGNRDMDPEVSGTEMTFGVSEISPTAQWYHTAPFTPGEEGTTLSLTPTVFNLALPQQTSAVIEADFLYWGIILPVGLPVGNYEGVNTFTATNGV